MKTFATSLIAFAFIANNASALSLEMPLADAHAEQNVIADVLPKFLADSAEIALELVKASNI